MSRLFKEGDSSERGWSEEASAGYGYELQDQAMERLGEPFTTELNSCQTSGTIRALAEKYKIDLTKPEYEELLSYAGFIGSMFGFQDEKKPLKKTK